MHIKIAMNIRVQLGLVGVHCLHVEHVEIIMQYTTLAT